jgi:molybdate transport system substrate-binding protein
MRIVTCATIVLTMTASVTRADDLVVYGAGSLREAIGQITTEFGRERGLTVTAQFGPSGRMRERIEKGEHVDLFTSADVGQARKLVEDGRASIMAVFVRNTVCLLSPAKFGATTRTAFDKLVDPGVHVGISPPKIDPLGDYTDRLFELMDRLRPRSGTAIRSRAVILDTPPGAPPPRSGDTDVDAILEGKVDTAIVYCSSRDRYARLLPDAVIVQLPSELQIGPEYALAVLKNAHPAAELLALTILSPEGQKIMAQRGFRPVTLPSD